MEGNKNEDHVPYTTSTQNLATLLFQNSTRDGNSDIGKPPS